ncbi:nitrilase/cyanide hydratase and apolipoprotein N-acyltransferase family protein [Actinidia rufa]|uniref:Nitrilase/cyanide hydratase and apolipoprotein N-acyltransferase family protein n=1 Tax=Actinidia rufa TaxID=165716 RepID=A0A7J0DW03_9ERIC|nr:nitrilase/cyanide hydratase and apolipoprotein N-acyltransferase family protein [Actinidia rufa]
MKAAIGFFSSSTLDSATPSLLKSSLSLSSHTLLTPSFPLPKCNFSNNSPNIAKPKRTTVASATTTMTASFKPDEARVPPVVPLPTPPLTKFKIALCQLLMTTDKERNIAHARKAIEEAANKGAQLVLLPEIWNSPYSNDSFPVYAEDIDAGGDASPSTAMMSELSRNLYRSQLLVALYQNVLIHLFDIDIPGQMTFKESLTLTAGESPTIVDTGWCAFQSVGRRPKSCHMLDLIYSCYFIDSFE